MWRFLQSLPRGARTVRPSQCCTQDSGDDIGNNFCHGQLPLQSPQSCSVACHHTSSTGAREHRCQLVQLSRCLYRRLPKWVSRDVNSSHLHSSDRPKFHWLWAVSCETYPHLADCQDEEGREKWRRFTRRRQQILFTNSILNAVGWGSAAALTWSLYQYLRSCFFLYSNGSHLNVKNNVSDCATSCEDNEGTSQEVYDNRTSLKYGRNEDDRSPFSSYFPFYNLKSSIGLQNDRQRPHLQHIFIQNAEEGANSLINLPNEQNVWCLYSDIKPQIEDDKDYLQSQVVERDDDSGFSESLGRVKNNSQGSNHTLLVTSVGTQTLQETVLEEEGSLSDTTGSEYSKADQSIGLCSPPSNICQGQLKSPDLEIKTENSLPFKTVPVDSFESYLSSSAESEISETQSSTSTEISKTQSSTSTKYNHNTNTADLNDGLKVVIEAGKEEISNFSTELLSILEERINYSITHDDPGAAVPYFHAGVSLGDASSNYNLALCYQMGHGVERDFQKARELYETASHLGHGWATYNLAVMLSEGQGGPCDTVKAHYLLVKAAKLGVEEAKVVLERMKSEDKKVSCEVCNPKCHDSFTSNYSTSSEYFLLQKCILTMQ
ncbi:uncharacterized protein LOC135209547 isoform X2 [Macrobrachium nipponense]|uniref:uncharacterized protein LOC135209547 isoform X2 n=1 Tax=Macrobrachium nipponense TaxID=159736 RepID=UPI0030C7DAF7